MKTNRIEKPENAKYERSKAVPRLLCGMGLNPPRTDCKFYSEQRDMCAIIPCCALHEELGNCHCDGCDKYKSKYEPEKAKTADEMARELGYTEKNESKDWVIYLDKKYDVQLEINFDDEVVSRYCTHKDAPGYLIGVTFDDMKLAERIVEERNKSNENS